MVADHPIRVSDRRLEWFLAALTIVWSAPLIVGASLLDAAATDALSGIMAPELWGKTGSALGAAHLLALYLNGGKGWTPHVRLAVTALGAAFFAFLAAAIAFQEPAAAGARVYAMTAGGLVWCCSAAARDIVRQARRKHV